MLKIKALSVNQSYKGRKFPTQELKRYKSDLSYLLPKSNIPAGKLEVKYIFGCSSKNSDADNCVKSFQDILAEYYGFNDKMIYRLNIEKVDVKKGEEYVAFEIKEYAEKENISIP